MSQALFNQITEEIIQLCLAVTHDVVEATTDVNLIQERSEELGRAIREDVTSLRDRIRGLTASIDPIEARIAQARGRVEPVLEQVGDAVVATGGEWGAVLEAGGAGTDHLGAQLSDSAQSITTQLRTVSEDAASLAQQLRQLDEETASGQEAAWQAFIAFSQAAEAAWTELDQRHHTWTREVDAVSVEAVNGVAAYTRALAGTLREHARAAIEAANDAIDAHNEALPGVELRYVRFIAEGLTQAGDDYGVALDAVNALPQDVQPTLDAATSGLRATMSTLSDEAGDLAAALLRDGRLARPG